MDDRFFDLLRRNVAGLVENFWRAGHVNVGVDTTHLDVAGTVREINAAIPEIYSD